jgi:hypothetical protein
VRIINNFNRLVFLSWLTKEQNGMSWSWSYGSWIYNYVCNNLWIRIPFRRGVLDTTLCDKICQWLATGRWFSPVSSTNKTDRTDITERLLKVVLNTIILNHQTNEHKVAVSFIDSLLFPDRKWMWSYPLSGKSYNTRHVQTSAMGGGVARYSILSIQDLVQTCIPMVGRFVSPPHSNIWNDWWVLNKIVVF